MNRQELLLLVKGVAQQCEKETGLTLTARALDALVTLTRALVQELGREPTTVEFAARMGLPPQTIRQVRQVAQAPVPLDAPLGADGEHTLGHVIEDRQAVSPTETMRAREATEQIEAVLNTLSDREAQILRMRFGMGDGRERTLTEIGHTFAVSRNASARSKCRRCGDCATRRAAAGSGCSGKAWSSPAKEAPSQRWRCGTDLAATVEGPWLVSFTRLEPLTGFTPQAWRR